MYEVYAFFCFLCKVSRLVEEIREGTRLSRPREYGIDRAAKVMQGLQVHMVYKFEN